MANASHPVIPKRTVAPLFDFRLSIQRAYALGGNVTLRQTDHAAIQRAMDAYLARLGQPGESFMTYLSPHEREELEGAHFCLEHRFEAPDYLGESEERSKAEIQGIVITLRVVKSTLAKPGLYLGW